MKLELIIGGRTIDAEFSMSDGTALLTFDGRTHEADISEPEPDLFVAIIDGKVHRCTIEKLPSGETEAVINGKRIPVAAFDKKHLSSKPGAGGPGSGKISLIAPMPGKVVKVLLNQGDEVAANQGVIIVEAMKMQNEVQSPRSGKVIEIKVTEGQTVNSGEVMAVVE